MTRSALSKALDQIVETFDGRRPRAYRLADLRSMVEDHREEWKLTPSTRASEVIGALEERGLLEKVVLRHAPPGSDGGQDGRPTVYSPLTRYRWRDCTPLELGSTLRESGYFSHGTAAYIHGLVDPVPKNYFVNYEQSPKPPPTQKPTQELIDRAFSGRQRRSRYIFRDRDVTFTMLNGKHTGRYGVETLQLGDGSDASVQVSNLERTLVDIVVRPDYSGGVEQILRAYETALAPDRARSVSLGRIVATLNALDLHYPYHQAVGFLLERSGFEPKKLERLKSRGLEFDFYLGYKIADRAFDRSWRIFYPEGL